ncbi:conserved hypothetical protein [Arthrobacter sp. 8AJ]|nr:conserved hypothetical protein [Arthrobacter sp. 8AJ]
MCWMTDWTRRLQSRRKYPGSKKAGLRGEPKGRPFLFEDSCGLLADYARFSRGILLDAVVELELVGVRAQGQRTDLVLVLVLDPGVDQVLGEDTAGLQELVVLAQGLQGFLEGARSLGDVLGFLGRELVEVLVDGSRGLDAVADAVNAGHQLGSEGQVRVGGGVRSAEFDALGLRVGARDGDADTGGAVALRVDHVNRSLEALDQAAVGVHRRVGEGQDGGGVLEQAADVPAGGVGQAGVALLVVEQRLATVPQRLVAVHARAVVAEDRLRHEGHRLAPGVSGVLDDVLELLQVIGSVGEGGELVVDLGLAGGSNFVVAALDLEAGFVQGNTHGVAQVSLLVGGGDREVTALDGGLVAQVAAFFLAAAVPVGFFGVDLVEAALGGGLVLDVVEHEELGFGSEECGVGDAGGGQVGLGLLGHAAGVAVVRVTGARVDDREVQREGLLHAEGVQERGGDVRDQLHVRFGDALESADGGTVEELSVDEEISVNTLRGDVKVLLDTRKVGEADIDELYIFVLDELEDFVRSLEHLCS